MVGCQAVTQKPDAHALGAAFSGISDRPFEIAATSRFLGLTVAQNKQLSGHPSLPISSSTQCRLRASKSTPPLAS